MKLETNNSSDYFWYVSYEILQKIETAGYLDSRSSYEQYMIDNPWVAKSKGVNIRFSA